jgi:hypothetical protein
MNMIQWDDDSHRWLMGRYPVLLVFMCFCVFILKNYIKKFMKKLIKNMSG